MRILAFIAVLMLLGIGTYNVAKADEPYIITASTSREYTTSTVATDFVGNQTYIVRILCTSSCMVAISDGSTTAETSAPTILNQNTAEIFAIRPGNSIIVIQVSIGGEIHVSELSK